MALEEEILRFIRAVLIDYADAREKLILALSVSLIHAACVTIVFVDNLEGLREYEEKCALKSFKKDLLRKVKFS